jgi:uncharacterized Fe-S cluster-containing radical SAM superfamily protein
VLLAEETEKIVCKGNKRKYTGFVLDPEYRGIVTGYTAGCSLRCVFCSGDWSRDYPEKSGHFYSPKEVFNKLSSIAERLETKRMRISGAEPTIGKAHILELLEYVENSEFQIFVLETNGTIFGIDQEYVQAISNFKKVHVRVSLKAGTPCDFARKTGAIRESFDIPFEAIRNLIKYKIKFNVAAVTDPRLMSEEERDNLLRKLESINPRILLNLEEEVMLPYRTTLARLQQAGFDWHKYVLPWQIMKIVRKMPKNKVVDLRSLSYILQRARKSS